MTPEIKKLNETPVNESVIYIINKDDRLDRNLFSETESKYIKSRLKDDEKQISVNHYSWWTYIQVIDKEKEIYQVNENLRKSANKLYPVIKSNKHKSITIIDRVNNAKAVLAFAEGLALSNYQFIKYFKDADKKKYLLEKINIISPKVRKKDIEHLNIIVKAVYISRDMINEPVSYLTASELSREIKKAGKMCGFRVEVFEKKKIESLKMGGILAVNKGSIDPPTFSVLEWKPANARNKRPYILVGKGIVFDTGGLSLKPTKGSMDLMKSDMSGAAAVIGIMYAVSMSKLPLYVLGLIPATDNRPGGNAYAPQDIIKMHNGSTVEVLNTDAEGRMILADALSYAKQYKPALVINLATLTGSASAAIGKYGIVGMGNADRKTFDKLKTSGDNVFERIVEFPFWEEYGELIKSEVADIKNIGGRDAGAITAGKFLEHFTDYRFIHLDIAGPAFLESADSYRGQGGTGTGVRLLFDFFKNKI